MGVKVSESRPRFTGGISVIIVDFALCVGIVRMINFSYLFQRRSELD